MKTCMTPTCAKLAVTLRSLLWIALLFTFTSLSINAQGIRSATDATTPSGLSPGAPLGSYSLSGFENVNIYNGNLNVSLPLLRIGGRGNAQTTMMLAVDSAHWRIEKEQNSCQIGGVPPIFGNFREEHTDICNNQGPFYYASPESWQNRRPGYGPGVMVVRRSGLGAMNNPNFYTTITSLTFIAPDGTEYELRDVESGGKPQAFVLANGPFNRRKVFVSSDGSAMTFVSNVDILDSGKQGLFAVTYPSGYLMMADGTRYDIEAGFVKAIRDRNGNMLKFVYGGSGISYGKVTQITDSLNRTVDISYTTTADTITYKGFGGASRTIQVLRGNLSGAFPVGSGYQTRPYNYLFTESMGINGASANHYNPEDIVTAVVLPDNRRYQFYYNEFGEVVRVELPTGAAIEYDYTLPANSIFFDGQDPQIYRRVTKRRMYPNGGTGSTYESEQTYEASYSGDGTTAQPYLATATVEQRGADGILLAKSKHYYDGSPIASLMKAANRFALFSGWNEGKEKKTESFNLDGTTVLRTVENFWEQRAVVWWWNGWATNYQLSSAYEPANDPRLIRTETTLNDTNQNSKIEYSYDQYNNQTEVKEFDFGDNGTFGSLLRRSVTSYLTTSGSVDYTCAECPTGIPIHMRRLPIQQSVYDAGGVERARTTYEYDNYTTDTGHAGLTDRYNISGLCLLWNNSSQSCTTPSSVNYGTRGNVTRTTQWLIDGSNESPINNFQQYDIAGNVIKSIDGRGNPVMIDYADRFGAPDGEARQNTAPTQLGSLMSYAIPPSVSNVLGHTAYTQYDYSLGIAIDGEDINGVVSSGFYDDVLDRPTQIVLANNIPALRQQKTFSYDDQNLTVTVTADLRAYGDNLLKNQTVFDKLGHSVETRGFENSTDYVSTKQTYNAMGQVHQSSNPYRPQLGEQPAWSTTLYDVLSRVKSIKTPDNAEVLISYSGNTVTVNDQAGKQRKSVTDALGRLTKVYEAPNDTTNFNFQTSYLYDVLGNLGTVTQGTQTRTFVYDSLSRLTSATNPESGTIGYSYDSNGNLLTMVEARGTTASYSYDGLNRITQRSYTGGTAAATPTVSYSYEAIGVTNSKGKLTSVSSSVSSYNYPGYDALGRITASQQVTDGQTYSMNYEYDLAGNMTSQTYPTGRVVTQSFDNAGRLASINGYISGSAAKTYANLFGYSAHGAVERMRLGNGRWEHSSFNNRLQPTEIGLGNSATDSSVLKLNYEHGTTANNGNVLKQVITVPTIGTATGFTATQHYQYDQLNRLTGAQEINGTSSSWQSSGTLWQQKFGYDRFGNRAVDTANTTSTIVGPNPLISTLTNRITPRTSPAEYYEYDAAGNIKKGQSGDNFAYDAENKLDQYEGGATQSGGADYSYDGEGKRVKKARLSETTIFVYNVNGQLVAEYTTSTPEQNGTSYLTSDNLGSPRVITKSDGSVKSRHDYLPFGEELFAGKGGRTTNHGYSQQDGIHQRFTGRQRDDETGLDYFNARYYSSTQGRFASPDSFGGRLSNPQTLNRYSYVINNPLKWIDPTGHRQQDPTDENDPNRKHGIDENNQAFELDDKENLAEPHSIGSTEVDSRPDLAPSFHDWIPVWGGFRRSLYYNATGQPERALVSFIFSSVEGGLLGAGALVERAGVTALEVTERSLVTDVLVESDVAIATEAAQPVGAAAATSLIESAGELTPLVKGGVQGFVKGNPQQIMKNITEGATRLPGGHYKLANGTFVKLYQSTKSGVSTIQINASGLKYYIRILP